MHPKLSPDKTADVDPAEKRRKEEEGQIWAKLIAAGLTLKGIDERYGLPKGTASNAVAEPHVAGERAIAAALGTRPHFLWRTRYRADGRRLNPQPIWNYRAGRRAAAQATEAA